MTTSNPLPASDAAGAAMSRRWRAARGPARLAAAMLALAAALAMGACSTLPPRGDAGAPLEKRSTRVEAELAGIRGLSFDRPVPVGTMDREQLKAYLEKQLDKDWEKEGGPLLERAYKVLGLLPSDMDLKPWLADFMKNQIGGFYDPETKHYWTIEDDEEEKGEDEDDAGEGFVLAHELTHALEDQHFDLQAMDDARREDDDAALALHALVEGSAMDAGVEHAVWRLGAPISLAGPMGRLLPWAASWFTTEELIEMTEGDSHKESVDDLAAAPPIIRANLVFPYLQGWHFVNRVRSELGWEGVDLLYRDPPESTEQVIHPERWLDRRDRPVRIEPAAAPDGWTARYEETLGMLGTRVLLSSRLHPGKSCKGHDATCAAEGWDGDRFVLWETPAGDAVGWVTAWDRERDARRFEETYRALLARSGSPQRAAVSRRGGLVTVVEGAPEGEAEAAAEALLKSRVIRAGDDHGPESLAWRALLWPLALRRLEHGDEGWLVGGLLLHFRSSAQGWKLRLLSSLALHAESTPDRISFWTVLGLLGFTSDRSLDWDYARVPLLFRFHHRGDLTADGTERLRMSAVVSLLRYDQEDARRRVDLAWGLVRTGWGRGTLPGDHLRLLWIPVF